MKAVFNVVRTNPSSIEEVLSEDVSEMVITDNEIVLKFNDGSTDTVPLRTNNGDDAREWGGFSVFVTRVGLNIDMSK